MKCVLKNFIHKYLRRRKNITLEKPFSIKEKKHKVIGIISTKINTLSNYQCLNCAVA